MELKVKHDMYIRFNGFISKIKHIKMSKKGEVYIQFKEPNGMLATINIRLLDIKPSFNPIDLIEVGDIVKFDVTDEDNYAQLLGMNVWEISCDEELLGFKDMIKMESAKLIQVLTHEQFDLRAYKIGDE